MKKAKTKPHQKPTLDKSKVPKVLTEEWLKTTAEDAIAYGYIALDHLSCIMAEEADYTFALPKLWEKYQSDLRGAKEPEVTTERDRVGPWINLFYRWAFGMVQGVREGLESIPLLPIYRYNKDTGKLEERDSNRTDGTHVKLDELAEYLAETIGMWLPPRLFPNHKDRIPRERPPEKIKMEEGIEGKEILEKGLKPFQLLDVIKREAKKEWANCFKWLRDGYKARLQPYSPSSLQRIGIGNFLTKRLHPMLVPFNPYNDQKVDHIEDLLPHLSDLIFKRSEVEETLKEYGLYQQEETGTVDTAEAEDSPLPDDKATGLEIASSKYAFIKLGKLDLGKTHYDFIFKNQTIRLRGLGADYIYYLMRYYKYPDKIDVVQLLSDLGKPFDQKPSEQRVEKIDKKALAQVIKKLNLGKQGEQKLKDIACDEPELIERYLKESTFRGKIKTFSNEKDKIIDSVRKAMANILSEIRRSNEEAYNHLHTAFKPLKSNPKSYTPTEDIPWKFN